MPPTRRDPTSPARLLRFLALSLARVLAAALFRHKTQKLSYRLVTFAIIALHVALAVWLLRS